VSRGCPKPSTCPRFLPKLHFIARAGYLGEATIYFLLSDLSSQRFQLIKALEIPWGPAAAAQADLDSRLPQNHPSARLLTLRLFPPGRLSIASISPYSLAST